MSEELTKRVADLENGLTDLIAGSKALGRAIGDITALATAQRIAISALIDHLATDEAHARAIAQSIAQIEEEATAHLLNTRTRDEGIARAREVLRKLPPLRVAAFLPQA